MQRQIEAKLGLLFAHNTQARLDLGVMCVTPLRPGWFDRVYKFDSQLEVVRQALICALLTRLTHGLMWCLLRLAGHLQVLQ